MRFAEASQVANHRTLLRPKKVLVTYFAKIITLGSVAVLLSAVVCAQGQEIRVAAAADLKFAMGELTEKFEKQTGTKVNVTFGSSGNFFSQMQNGAPFDLFFSADIEYAKKLEAAGLAEPGTLYGYAVGRIVIWTPADAKVDVTKQGWKVLLDASVEKIAIANPEHAPYGRAAVAALQKAGIYESVKAKLVYGENISQAAQFVQSGNAQAGIVAMSLAVSPAMRDGKSWEIPAEMHPALEQGAIILKDAKNKDAARAFLEFVKSARGRATLAEYGFEFSEKTGKVEKR
jgi:molybdate transport system substrate-binding protein